MIGCRIGGCVVVDGLAWCRCRCGMMVQGFLRVYCQAQIRFSHFVSFCFDFCTCIWCGFFVSGLLKLLQNTWILHVDVDFSSRLGDFL